MHEPKMWTVERPEPVRADAQGVFLGHDLLPDAGCGDQVVIVCEGQRWLGRVAEIVERDDGRYLRLTESAV